ncbi:MAG TPA: GNAT family N-acetyltransferase [Thermodesulfobacteriota bacterium]|nr:GNAT family N-acetyltransferase [Thermodesulfobacteriota bacterium]
MGVAIRPWQKDDVASIRRITWQSWVATYSSFIPESDLRSYFDVHYTEASLLNMFDDPFTYGFIAEKDHHIAGFIRLLFNRDEGRLYVPSLYFLPGFQGQGMGRRLLGAAEGLARGKGLDRFWIGVMVENRQALAFYRKTGFQFVREEPFTMGKTTVSHVIGYKKLGRSSFLSQKIYTAFDEGGGAKGLPKLCLELLAEQKKVWPELREAYKLLKDVRERDVRCIGFSIRLQYNPGRIKNSLANVDEKNGNERRCFLCLDNLPGSQRGILYRSEYLILCNPMPVFSCHLIASHLDHRRQAIAEHIDTLLHLMTDFGSGWTVLYNGPKCGASAPDHLHFHVGPSGQMPIEKEIHEGKRLTLMKRIDGVSLYRLGDLGREVVVLEGDDWMAVRGAFKSYLNAMKEVLFVDEEPMINIAGFRKGEKWHVVIFPRQKHRPDIFFKEGDARVVVSPGVIDMGGLLITPVERDFYRLDAAAVEGIYGEVSLERKAVERAVDAMK